LAHFFELPVVVVVELTPLLGRAVVVTTTELSVLVVVEELTPLLGSAVVVVDTPLEVELCPPLGSAVVVVSPLVVTTEPLDVEVEELAPLLGRAVVVLVLVPVVPGPVLVVVTPPEGKFVLVVVTSWLVT